MSELFVLVTQTLSRRLRDGVYELSSCCLFVHSAPTSAILQTMQVNLTPHAEELLRTALAQHPGRSPAQILEQALAEQVHRETAATLAKPKLTREEFHAWLDQFTAYSDKIPSMPGETFSREMIYQDHD